MRVRVAAAMLAGSVVLASMGCTAKCAKAPSPPAEGGSTVAATEDEGARVPEDPGSRAGGPDEGAGAPGGPVAEEALQRLTVSFQSECCGINREAHDRLDALVRELEASLGVTLERRTAHWGKEGEVDECFDLRSLPPEARAKLGDLVTEALASEHLVVITPDSPCRPAP